jgi:hypothetical protein
MKTLSGTFTFVVLAVVAIVVVITFRAFAQPPAGKKFVLHIGRTAQDYVDVKDKDAFDKALRALESHGGQYEIGFKDDGKVTDPYHALNIKIDKVTTSKVAQNAPAGESAANDPNVVHLLRSDSAPDIKDVLDTFK